MQIVSRVRIKTKTRELSINTVIHIVYKLKEKTIESHPYLISIRAAKKNRADYTKQLKRNKIKSKIRFPPNRRG